MGEGYKGGMRLVTYTPLDSDTVSCLKRFSEKMR